MSSLIGKKFGDWTVIGESDIKKKHKLSVCKCDCGTIQDVYNNNLKRGLSTSCVKCRNKKVTDSRILGDSQKKSKYNGIYVSYRAILNRCYDSRTNGYEAYGGNGVKMCDEWKDDYLSFKKWSLDNGWEQGFVCSRNGDTGNYEPNNCRWISKSENSREANLGRKNPHRSLSDEDVREIKFSKLKISKNVKLTQKMLAEKFNISIRMVQAIRGGHSYKYVKEI